MDLELWPNCLNQPWPGLFWPQLLSTSNGPFTFMGNTRHRQRTTEEKDIWPKNRRCFCLSCNLGCLQSQKQDQFPIKFCNKAVHLAILHIGWILVFEQKNTLSKKSVSGTVLGQNPLEWKLHYRKSRYMGTRCIPTVILPKNQWSYIQFG